MLKKKGIILIFGIVILISLVSAEIQVGTSGSIGVDLNIPTAINYTLVNVNNSQYFQDYTPTTLGSWLETTFSWITNAVNDLVNYYTKTQSDTRYVEITGDTMTGDLVVIGTGNFTEGLIVSGFIPAGLSIYGYDNSRLEVIAGTPRLILENDGDRYIIDEGGDGFRFYRGGDNVTMRINNLSVQIGDTTEDKDLLVYGDLNMSNNNITDINYGFFDGKVGIGNTTPVAKLHISGGTGSLSTGLAFGDGDTGFFESADDTLKLSVGGTESWILQASVIGPNSATRAGILNEAGSATNPVFVVNRADLDTGIGRAAADQLSLIAGGVEGIRIDGAGNATVSGNVTADYFFGDGSQLSGVVLSESDPKWTANYSAYNDSWSSITNTSYYLKSNPFGFYNSTNPQTETDPLWTGNMSNVAFTNVDEVFDENVSFAKNISVDGSTFFVDSNTNSVGIGTTSPRALLDVSGNTNTVLSLSDKDTAVSAGQSIGAIEFYSADTTFAWQNSVRAKIDVIEDGGAAGGAYSITFSTLGHTPTGFFERMRIADDGNIGISQTSPQTTLHVGASTFTVNTTSGNVGIGTTTPSYPLEVNANVSGISIYSQANISATGYNTRTSIFDKSKNVWDYIKDADYYKKDNKIDHTKFYGYAGEITSTDYSKPVEIEYEEKVCEENEETFEVICTNQTLIRTTYPYTKLEGQVSLNAEIDLLRQALSEIKSCTETSKDWLEYQRCVNKV